MAPSLGRRIAACSTLPSLPALLGAVPAEYAAVVAEAGDAALSKRSGRDCVVAHGAAAAGPAPAPDPRGGPTAAGGAR
jgi:hypothetical protein